MVENAVIMKYSLCPSLIIDPQDQAFDWIKNMLTNSESSLNPEKKKNPVLSKIHHLQYLVQEQKRKV